MQRTRTSSPAAGGWPTSRRYPRTLGEAFGGVDYACAVERHRPVCMRLGRALGCVAVIAAAAIIFVLTFGVQ